MADLIAMNRFFAGALTLFPFPLPQCRESADFAGAFKTFCATNESTKQLVDRLTHARREMTRILADNIRYEEKLAAAENYLPLLFTLQESWTQRLNTPQLPPIKLDRELTFEWRLYVNGRPEMFKTNEFVFEIIMTYHFKVSLSLSISLSLSLSVSVSLSHFRYLSHSFPLLFLHRHYVTITSHKT
jgi:hypothetical protein